jgi:hypothetical protein
VLAACVRESRRHPNARIATIFPDTGLNYVSTTWSGAGSETGSTRSAHAAPVPAPNDAEHVSA